MLYFLSLTVHFKFEKEIYIQFNIHSFFVFQIYTVVNALWIFIDSLILIGKADFSIAFQL
jgi:hypothetical protein